MQQQQQQQKLQAQTWVIDTRRAHSRSREYHDRIVTFANFVYVWAARVVKSTLMCLESLSKYFGVRSATWLCICNDKTYLMFALDQSDWSMGQCASFLFQVQILQPDLLQSMIGICHHSSSQKNVQLLFSCGFCGAKSRYYLFGSSYHKRGRAIKRMLICTPCEGKELGAATVQCQNFS